jgi:hypothetical protein
VYMTSVPTTPDKIVEGDFIYSLPDP